MLHFPCLQFPKSLTAFNKLDENICQNVSPVGDDKSVCLKAQLVTARYSVRELYLPSVPIYALLRVCPPVQPVIQCV